MNQPLSLAQHFSHYFQVEPVLSPAAREEVFRLRFAVYCEELAYEDRSAFPDGMERDAYDEDAAFALIRHKQSGRAAGCVRLITNARTPDLQLPFEQVCQGRLDPAFIDLANWDRSKVGEISRLAVHQDFRRRRGEANTPEGASDGASSQVTDRHYPLLAMGLFLAGASLGLARNLDQVVVMMEPRLARLLQSCGIQFTQVGDVIDYHGRRGPFRITRDELLATIRPDSEQLLVAIRGVLG